MCSWSRIWLSATKAATADGSSDWPDPVSEMGTIDLAGGTGARSSHAHSSVEQIVS